MIAERTSGEELNECASERPWFDDVNIFAIIKRK